MQILNGGRSEMFVSYFDTQNKLMWIKKSIMNSESSQDF